MVKEKIKAHEKDYGNVVVNEKSSIGFDTIYFMKRLETKWNDWLYHIL